MWSNDRSEWFLFIAKESDGWERENVTSLVGDEVVVSPLARRAGCGVRRRGPMKDLGADRGDERRPSVGVHRWRRVASSPLRRRVGVWPPDL